MTQTSFGNRKPWALTTIGVCCALLTASARADFIDERGREPSATSAVSAGQSAAARGFGTIYGGFLGPEWNTPVADAGNEVPLATAIVRLLPKEHPPVEIDAPDALLSTKVSWASTMTRTQALMSIAARHSLNLTLSGRKVTVARYVPPAPATAVAAAAPAPAAAAAAPAAATAPAPAPAPKKNFEVRLNDIKLATAIQRWASESGVRVRWDADKHVLISAPMVFSGTDVMDAITQVLSTPGIRNSDYPLEVCEYPNVPRLLRITRQGEQAKDCPG